MYFITYTIIVNTAFTNGFAGFGCRVNLVAGLTVALVAAYLVDAHLAAGVWAGALIDICREGHRNTVRVEHRSTERLEHSETVTQKHRETGTQ